MNKKANTLLFLLGATLFNILVTILCFAGLFAFYVKLIMPHLSNEAHVWGFSLSFIAAIVISFFVYRFLLRFLMKKFQPEKYFDPIFGGRRKQ